MVEHVLGKDGVMGSNPISSSVPAAHAGGIEGAQDSEPGLMPRFGSPVMSPASWLGVEIAPRLAEVAPRWERRLKKQPID